MTHRHSNDEAKGWIGWVLGDFSISAWRIIKPNHTNPLVGDLDCQFEPKPLLVFGPCIFSHISDHFE